LSILKLEISKFSLSLLSYFSGALWSVAPSRQAKTTATKGFRKGKEHGTGIEHFPNMCEDLDSTPSTTTKQTNSNNKTKNKEQQNEPKNLGKQYKDVSRDKTWGPNKFSELYH
jgi:hypothetical protein